jgi:hypothetical protein
VADRFLAVDVFPGLAGQDGHQRVPVIGHRDRHRIDVAVVEHTPEVRFRPWIAAPLLLRKRQGRLEMALVDVDDVSDAHVPDAGQMLVMIEAAAARGPCGMAFVVASQADDGDIDRVVRTALCAKTRRAHRESNGGGGSARQEHASVHHGRTSSANRIVHESEPG